LSVCLVLWASLPEIKTDDDDDDDDDDDCIGAQWGTTSHDVCVVGDEAQSAEVESRTAAAAQPCRAPAGTMHQPTQHARASAHNNNNNNNIPTHFCHATTLQLRAFARHSAS